MRAPCRYCLARPECLPTNTRRPAVPPALATMQRFAWNEAKYPSRRPLKDLVASIMDTVQKLDDDLKVGRVLEGEGEMAGWVAGGWGLRGGAGGGGWHEM